ncbi:MAG: hypothetical protein ACLFPD_08625 [Desulfosudaceae bacterium]
MRGAFLVVMLIALLIVGFLVVKNMTTETEGAGKMETVQKAKDAARQAEDSAGDIDDRARKATRDLNLAD